MRTLSARFTTYISLCFSVAGLIQAQHLRLGIIGGTAITPDYTAYYSPEHRITLPDGTVAVVLAVSNSSGPRSPIGGPTLTWEFNDRFSIETNAIYRRLRLESGGPTVTWEFPVLAKYRVPVPGAALRPFLEIGPAFRSVGNRNTNPSHAGFAAGAGFDWQWHGTRFAPTLRYTRWARESDFESVRSRRDQLEALFAISHYSESDRHPLGNAVGLGVAGGLTLVHLMPATNFGEFETGGNRYSSTRDSLRSFILGPRVEARLAPQWMILAEADYRQVRYRDNTSFDFIDSTGVRRQGTTSSTGKSAVLWQFPVLLRHTFGHGMAQPFLDAGASFRLPQEIGGKLSTLGVTAASGVRFRRRGLNLESGLRFSYWGSTKYRNGETAANGVSRNQLDAVFAFAF